MSNKKTKKDLVQRVEVQEPRVLIEHYAVTEGTLAEKAAKAIFTQSYIPLEWATDMKGWTEILRGTEQIILETITQARMMCPQFLSEDDAEP